MSRPAIDKCINPVACTASDPNSAMGITDSTAVTSLGTINSDLTASETQLELEDRGGRKSDFVSFGRHKVPQCLIGTAFIWRACVVVLLSEYK